MSGEIASFQRPPLPARKGSQSSDALMEARKKKKKEKKDKKEEKEKRPHRFTKRPRGYVRGKFKNLLTTSDASFQLDRSDSSSSSSSSDDEKHVEERSKSPRVAEKPLEAEKDGPTSSPRSPRGSKQDLKSATTINEPEAPRPKRPNRRRFSTEGRLQGTFLVVEEKVETRHKRSGSVSKRPTSLDHISNDSNDHRNSNHISFTLRHFKDPARKEEKRKRKQLKKLETDQASHPIAWAVGRVLFPFEIGFQVSASKAYPPAYHWLTRIDDVLLVGGIIFKKEVKNLVKYQNVGGVINMCEEWKGPVKEYKKYGVENCYMPTCDPVHVALSSLIKGVEFIEKIAAQGRCVVVHCKAGRGRSSSVAICYYIKHKGMTAKEANEFLWQKREFTHKNLWKRVGIQEFEKEFRGKGMKETTEDRKDEQKSETPTSDKGKEKEEEGEEGERPTSSRPAKWRLSEKGSTIKKGTEIGRQKEYATKSKDSSDSDKDLTQSKSDKEKDSSSEGGFRRPTKSKKKDKKEKKEKEDEDLLPKAKSARVSHVKKPLKTKGHRRMSSTQGRIEQTDSRDRLGTGPLQLKRCASEAPTTDESSTSESQKETKKKKMKEKRKAAKALNSPTSTESEVSSLDKKDKKEKKEKVKEEHVVKEEEEIDEGWIIDDKRHSDKELEKKDKKDKKEKKDKQHSNKASAKTSSSSSNTSSGEIEELKEQQLVVEEDKKKKKHSKKSSDESDNNNNHNNNNNTHNNNNNNNSKIPKTFSRVKRPTATQRELLGSQREESILPVLNGQGHENGGSGGSEIVKPNSPRGETSRASSTPVSPRGQERKLAKWLPAGKPLSSSSS